MTTNDPMLAFYEKLKALVPAEKLEEIFGDLAVLFAQNAHASEEHVRAQFLDPAGADEIKAFSEAAVALTPLDEEMRARTLDALQALLLPPPPDFLTRITPALHGFGETAARLLVERQAQAAEDSGLKAAKELFKDKSTTIHLNEDELLVGTVVYEDGKAWLSDGWNTKVEITKDDLEKYMAALDAERKKT